MFRWYQNAAACYVYLADVATSSSSSASGMASSRWFTRGWTLQELIAPKDVRFYSSTWEFIDTKANMCKLISDMTGISTHVLLLNMDLESVSVARRMSWASRRKTSRIEDMAYCLLGIFDVNLPLIYGEGRKAFQRLQEAIMLKTHDQSLFAWGIPVETPSGILTDDQVFGLEPIKWKPLAHRQQPLLVGLFADGPERFQFSSNIEPAHRFSHELRRTHPPVLVSGGVLLGLMKAPREFFTAMHVDRPALVAPAATHIAVLLCSIGGIGGKLVGLALRDWGEGYVGRTPELVQLDMRVSKVRLETAVHQWHVMKEDPLLLRHRDIIFQRLFHGKFEVGAITRRKNSVPAWDRTVWGKCDVFRMVAGAVEEEEDDYIRYNFKITSSSGLAVTFKRSLVGVAAGPMGSLVVNVLPISIHHQAVVDTEAGSAKSVPAARPLQPDRFNCSHVMKTPSDSWALETEGYPGIYIRAERRYLNEGRNEAVDIINFFMCPNGTDAERAKKAIASGAT